MPLTTKIQGLLGGEVELNPYETRTFLAVIEDSLKDNPHFPNRAKIEELAEMLRYERMEWLQSRE